MDRIQHHPSWSNPPPNPKRGTSPGYERDLTSHFFQRGSVIESWAPFMICTMLVYMTCTDHWYWLTTTLLGSKRRKLHHHTTAVAHRFTIHCVIPVWYVLIVSGVGWSWPGWASGSKAAAVGGTRFKSTPIRERVLTVGAVRSFGLARKLEYPGFAPVSSFTRLFLGRMYPDLRESVASFPG